MEKSAENKANFITAPKAAEILGISAATVRNWRKLGKLHAVLNGSVYLFSESDCLALKKDLQKMGKLKSRRNKSLNDSNYIPTGYISSSSENLSVIKELISYLQDKNYSVSDILAHYAKSFMSAQNINRNVSSSLLKDFETDGSQTAFPYEDFKLSYVQNEDTLGLLYISLKRMQDKKNSGSYYTPFYIVNRVNSLAFSDFHKSSIISVCDPCCGTGNFLLGLPTDIPLSNIYGLDIDKTAIAIARINLALKYHVSSDKDLFILKNNIVVFDFIENKIDKSFDLIIGNPPWGSKFSAEKASRYRSLFRSFTGNKMPESFDLFIERSLEHLNNKGRLLFLLPESFLSANIHKPVRELILKKGSVTDLVYLGNVFDKVLCPCIISGFVSSRRSSDINVSFDNKTKQILRCERSFVAPSERINKDSFHVLSDSKEYELIKKMESCPHFTLKGKADFGLGIVTGANKALIKDKEYAGNNTEYEAIIKGNEIYPYVIKEPSSYIKFTPSYFQQVAPTEIYRAKQKLFYRFISKDLIFAMDNEGRLSLNSANIMIPKVKGYSIEYVMAILNSSAMRFYYRHKYRDVKVLRSVLEALPIPQCDDKTQRKITLLAQRGAENYTQIDDIIFKLYGISQKDMVYFSSLK
ncbi:MAG: N-6 DNA methylase [Butyrivibrio sp.]|nr:N-6 DNA methylase [Butyrivibrio sp.]